MLLKDKTTLTIADAIAVTGIGRTKLYDLMRSGEIEARKCGTRTLITATSLQAFVENLPKATPPKAA